MRDSRMRKADSLILYSTNQLLFKLQLFKPCNINIRKQLISFLAHIKKVFIALCNILSFAFYPCQFSQPFKILVMPYNPCLCIILGRKGDYKKLPIRGL